MRLLLTLLLIGPLLMTSAKAHAFDPEQSLRELAGTQQNRIPQEYRVAKDDGGMSLSEAIASVRRQTDGQIVSAETRVSNGRETHHIKVLTKDGKVKTVKVPGRKIGGG